MKEIPPQQTFLLLPDEIKRCYRVFENSKISQTNVRQEAWAEVTEQMTETAIYEGGQYFKSLLPRAFELAWRDSDNCWALEHTLRPLLSFGWREWPLDEQRAIEECLALLWRAEIEREDGAPEGVWCVAGLLELSLVPLLESWLASGLSVWAIYGVLDWGDERWSQPSPERTWLCQPHVLERVEADFFQAANESEAVAISRLHDFLLWMCDE